LELLVGLVITLVTFFCVIVAKNAISAGMSRGEEWGNVEGGKFPRQDTQKNRITTLKLPICKFQNANLQI
jgi:hypothetical protein